MTSIQNDTPTTTTILSLPPELIAYILNLSCESLITGRNETNTRKYQHLRNCSLISSSFRLPAQSELWNNVQIWSQIRAQQFLTISLPFFTNSLTLSGIKGSLGEGAEGITSHVGIKIVSTRMARGLRILELKDFGKLRAEILLYPNLIDLKSLTLSTSFLPLPTSFFVPPFSLTSLYLYSSCSNSPSLVIHSILLVSSKTLKYLNISLPKGSTAYEGLLTGMEYLGGEIRDVNTTVGGLHELVLSRRLEIGGLLEKIKLLRGLKRLVVGFAEDLEGLLDGLELGGLNCCQLESIRITIDYNLLPTIQILSTRLFSISISSTTPLLHRIQGHQFRLLENLKLIQLSNANHRGGYGLEVEKFRKNCEEREIELSFLNGL